MSIIVRLEGGLGNQMFQYAAARALSSRLDLTLRLDLGSYQKDVKRDYRLHHFNIAEKVASEQDMTEYIRILNKPVGDETFYAKWKRGLTPWYLKPVIRQPHFHYPPGFRKIKRSCYLLGYWQSEKYFSDIENIIRMEFTFRDPARILDLCAGQIPDKNRHSVSVHIRRGDYADNPRTQRSHGVLGMDYYKRAVDFIMAKIKEPQFYLFSDDMEWVKENWKLDVDTQFMEAPLEDSDLVDLYRMKHCSHHIIANSSFSWWGAWLSENPDKKVVAPVRWFPDERMKTIKRLDHIPEQWVTL